MYAIIRTGGKQYQVAAGDRLKVEKLEGEVGSTVELQDVLLVVNGDNVSERNADGSHRWQGLQWWSYHHPQWTNLMLWGTRDSPAPLTLRHVEKLELTNIAVEEAARSLMRSLGPVGAP